MDTEKEPETYGEGQESPTVAYERSDVGAFRISIAAAAFLIGTFAAVVFVALPFMGFKTHRVEVSPSRSPQAATGWREPPNPRLQASPELDLQGYTAGYDKRLGSYSWVDRPRGVAAIPINRALSIAARRGVPRSSVNPALVLSQPAQGDRRTGMQGKVVAPPQ